MTNDMSISKTIIDATFQFLKQSLKHKKPTCNLPSVVHKILGHSSSQNMPEIEGVK